KGDLLDRLRRRVVTVRRIDDEEGVKIELRPPRHVADASGRADKNRVDQAEFCRLERALERNLIARVGDGGLGRPQLPGRLDQALIFVVAGRVPGALILRHRPSPHSPARVRRIGTAPRPVPSVGFPPPTTSRSRPPRGAVRRVPPAAASPRAAATPTVRTWHAPGPA